MDTEHLRKYQNPYRILDYEMNNYDGKYTTRCITMKFLDYVSKVCKQQGYKLSKNYMILNNLNNVVYWLYITKKQDQYIINVYNNDQEREYIFTEVELLNLIT